MLNATFITAVLRHVLTAAGGALAVKYQLDGSHVELVAAGLAGLAGIGWSLWDKRRRAAG